MNGISLWHCTAIFLVISVEWDGPLRSIKVLYQVRLVNQTNLCEPFEIEFANEKMRRL